MDLVSEKDFPANYSTAVLEVLEAMSMTNTRKMRVIGSSSLRSQLYAGDYDVEEQIDFLPPTIAQNLKEIVKKVRSLSNAVITETKCGEVPQWNVFRPLARVEKGKIYDFNIKESQSKIDALRTAGVLTEGEAKEANELLSKATDAWGFLNARKTIRHHILRWQPREILEGFKLYRKLKITLEDAVKSGGMIKVDVVADIRDRFTEFSVVYTPMKNGKRVFTNRLPLALGLTEDLIYYDKINPFKAVKRCFSLARLHKRYGLLKKLTLVLNSDLGRLYQIIGDLKTIETLLDHRNFPSRRIEDIRSEIDDVRERLGNIYSLRDFLKKQHILIGSLYSLLKTPIPQLGQKLGVFIEALQKILDSSTTRKVSDLIVKEGGAKTEITELTKKFYSEQSKEDRQKLGQFYTPDNLITKAFDTLDIPKEAPVLEPTAGSGQFVEALLKRGFSNITANEFDTKPYTILVENYAPRGVNITQGDYLTKEFDTKFDLVIGNPPYFMFRGKHGTISKEVAKKYKDVIKGTANIYVLSTVKGLMDLNEGGVLSYVIPTSILASPMFQKARNWIAQRANIERVEVHTQKDEFEGANVEVMIFQLRKTSSPNMDFKRKQGEDYIFLKGKEGRVMEKVEGEETIGSLAKFKTGGMDIAKIPKDQREKVLSATQKEGFYPIIYGENIADDGVREDGKIKKGRSQYLSKDFKPSVVIQPPFLIAKRTVGTKKDLKVALVEAGRNTNYYPENHTYWAKGKIEDLRRIHKVLTAKERPFLDDVNSLSISSELLNKVVVPQ